MHQQPGLNLDLRYILKSIDDLILLIDEDLVYRQYWTNDESLLWFKPEEFMGKPIPALLQEPLRTQSIDAIVKALKEQQPTKLIYQAPNPDIEQWFRVKIFPLKEYDEAGKQLVLLIIGDCTEEVTLKKRNRIFEALIAQNWEAIRFSDMDLNVQYVNPALERLYGYEPGELMGQQVSLFIDDDRYTTAQIKNIVLQEGSWSGEIWQVRKDRTRFESFLSVQLIYDMDGSPMGFISQSKDISQRKETASKLKNIIDERDTLLREIHHRVKNNLQVITSLLSLQASNLTDYHIRDLFQQSQYRINAMAMIHETLYRSDNFSNISYDQYIHTLAQFLILSMKGVEHRITLEVEATDVLLGIDTAVPLGLLINEVITNALKYGILSNKPGCIYIRLQCLPCKRYRLLIGDNGQGYPAHVTFKNTRSLGLKLIYSLTRQLNGTIMRHLDRPGTHYQIEFGKAVSVQAQTNGQPSPA